jgi:hypothetical protein
MVPILWNRASQKVCQTRWMDERQAEMASSRWFPVVAWLLLAISLAWIVLWVTSIVRHNTDWFQLGIAISFALISLYCRLLIRRYRRSTL